uniref:Uncharacterized protein n=1 Tax=Anguilla anguilla TaxID=7936 RepID=A0A0E9WC47_ANGAN
MNRASSLRLIKVPNNLPIYTGSERTDWLPTWQSSCAIIGFLIFFFVSCTAVNKDYERNGSLSDKRFTTG